MRDNYHTPGCQTRPVHGRALHRGPSAGRPRKLWPPQATTGALRSYWYVEITDTRSSPGAAAAVTELYAAHALGLVRLAVLLGPGCG